MSNMNYCRFENTLSDLQDCYNALMNQEGLCKREYEHAQNLIRLCNDMTEMSPEKENECENCGDPTEEGHTLCPACNEEYEEKCRKEEEECCECNLSENECECK